MDICQECFDDLVMKFNGDKLVCKSCGYEEKIAIGLTNKKDNNWYDGDEPRFLLDEDSICYGCQHYIDAEDGCNPLEICIEGNLNDYRMDG
ncbi:MAG: hypothetical protein PHH48_09315 [Eubacteriales bacterium]|nr:hypothetical protein [Eubacteriales bacterium]